jgi:hypothetical protein
MAIWFMYFFGHLVLFSCFGYGVPRKIWQPSAILVNVRAWKNCAKHTYEGTEKFAESTCFTHVDSFFIDAYIVSLFR